MAESFRGYCLALLGGVAGAPLGLILSPVVLFLLTRVMKGEGEEEVPNRFAVWALIGVVGAPLSLIVSNPGFLHLYQRSLMAGYAAFAVAGGESPVQFQGVDRSAQEGSPAGIGSDIRPAQAIIRVGGFTLSNARIRPFSGDSTGVGFSGELWDVYVDATNNTKDVKIPSHVLSVELIDSEGRSFNSADALIASSEVLDESLGGALKLDKFTDAILPGATRQGVRVGVFDVTQGVKGLKLCAGEILYPGKQCLRGGL